MLLVPHAAVYFCGQPVDLRKGCEGLAYISCAIDPKPFENTYFIFLNRKRNRVKILYWTASSFFYWFTRLEKVSLHQRKR